MPKRAVIRFEERAQIGMAFLLVLLNVGERGVGEIAISEGTVPDVLVRDGLHGSVGRVVGCELHDAFSVPGRAGRVHRTGGAGQPRAQRGRGDQTGDESCEESHSFFIPSYCF